MTEDWREGYQRAMLVLMARRGAAVEEDRGRRSYGGWEDYDATELMRDHMRGCEPQLTASSTLCESQWEEFDGTFAEPPWSQRHGVDVYLSCTCGYVRDMRVRLASTVGQIMVWLLGGDQ